LSAIEQGIIQREIQESAYRAQQRIDARKDIVVGVNQHVTADGAPVPVMQVNPDVEQRQVASVRAVRASRSQSEWRASLDRVKAAARDGNNLVPPVVSAVEAHATLGEISDAMRSVFGEHEEIDA